MINSYITAKMIDFYTIRIVLFTDIFKSDNIHVELIVNGDEVKKLDVSKKRFLNGLVIYDCKVKDKLELGNEYSVSVENFDFVPVIVSDVTNFKDFENEFYYEGDDLGARYSKEKTTFTLWAPLASNVALFVKKPGEDVYSTYKLKRETKGIYRITIFDDLEKAKYFYRVTNNGLTFKVTDPYAFSSSSNGKHSYVIDLNKIKQIPNNQEKLKIYKSYDEAIIYELHIRDFTMDSNTNIKNKGKFLGLVEEKRTTTENNPAGLDYLKYIGITHVQLLPIFDFKTVDEDNIESSYNWGYDPQQYFVPEGSYSIDPNDPYSRILELKTMISKLHEAGIKVNMDVVFNHVYDYRNSVFEKLVPNFFFRKNNQEIVTNGSGCGNELATEKLMVRKLIVDCIKYWMDIYDIDGFRFDLMGLIDIETMNEIQKVAVFKKIDAMIYGEGWDMGNVLKSSQKCAIINSFKTPNIAFFNDTFRDILKGPNGNEKIKEGGYLLGNISYRDGFKYAFLGTCIDKVFNKRFLNTGQTINYVECHDNMTIFDKVKEVYNASEENIEEVLNTIKLINGMILFSFGIPFFHAGQEIGLTKFNEDNTYNLGDKYNKFDYKIMDQRFKMVNYFKSLIDCRKKLYQETFDIMENLLSTEFFDLDNGGLMIVNIKKGVYLNHKNILIINPTDSRYRMSLDNYYLLVVDTGGALLNKDLYEQNIVIEPHSFKVYRKEEI